MTAELKSALKGLRSLAPPAPKQTQEISDRDVAIRILALEECPIGEDPVVTLKGFDESFDRWGEADHSGDCQKQPWTCVRCVHDETMERVSIARKLFDLSK